MNTLAFDAFVALESGRAKFMHVVIVSSRCGRLGLHPHVV